MTFGEKLAKLRKEENYTQEQLAELLDVSRQSVSKWESDISYPETTKLIELGKMFSCSMDYLLKDDITEKNGETIGAMNEKTEEIKSKVINEKNKKRYKNSIKIGTRIISLLIIIDIISFIIYYLIFGLPN